MFIEEITPSFLAFQVWDGNLQSETKIRICIFMRFRDTEYSEIMEESCSFLDITVLTIAWSNINTLISYSK